MDFTPDTPDGIPDDIAALYTAPSSSGVDVSDLLDRMHQGEFSQESGGNYHSRPNPRTGATGGFQVLPSNIPSWTAKHYGKRLTRDEFLNNPDAQEAVFKGEMGDYLRTAKTQNPNADENTILRMGAAGWYGGKGAMRRYDDPTKFRPNEPSFREYTNSVAKRSGSGFDPFKAYATDEPQQAVKPSSFDDITDLYSQPSAEQPSVASLEPTSPVDLNGQPSATGQPFLAPQAPALPPQPAELGRNSFVPVGAGPNAGYNDTSAPEAPQGLQSPEPPPMDLPPPPPPIAMVHAPVQQQPPPAILHQPVHGTHTGVNIGTQDLDENGNVIPQPGPPLADIHNDQEAQNAVAETIQYPSDVKTAQDAEAYTKQQMQAKYPSGDFSKFQLLTPYHQGSTGAQITYGDLANAGIDTSQLTEQKRAENRIENPTPNLKPVPYDFAKDTSDAINEYYKGSKYGDLASAAVGGAVGGMGEVGGVISGLLSIARDLNPAVGSTQEILGDKYHVRDISDSTIDRWKQFYEGATNVMNATGGKNPDGTDTTPTQIFRFGGKMGVDLPKLAVMSMLPGGAITAFALNDAALTKLHGGTGADVAESAIKGGLTGALFHFVPPGVKKLMGAGTEDVAETVGHQAKRAVVESGLIFGGSVGIGAAAGDPLKENLLNAASNTAFHISGLVGRAKTSLEGKVIHAQDVDGNEVYAEIKPDGTLETTAPQKADYETLAPADVKTLIHKPSYGEPVKNEKNPEVLPQPASLDTGPNVPDAENATSKAPITDNTGPAEEPEKPAVKNDAVAPEKSSLPPEVDQRIRTLFKADAAKPESKPSAEPVGLQMAADSEPFYSRVEKTLKDTRQEKWSPETLEKTILNTPGVKPLDPDVQALSTWLKEQKGPVSRKDALEFIAANKADVGETMLSSKDAKFEDQTLPGEKTNYREEIITAPESAGNWKDGHREYDSIRNPIGRNRMSDRQTADGGKALVAEESQLPTEYEASKMPPVFHKHGEEILLKKLLHRAVTEGYDFLGLTTGKQQLERNDLSNQLDSISYKRSIVGGVRTERPIFDITLEKDGKVIASRNHQTRREMERVIGKDATKKIIERFDRGGTLKGKDLVVGGENLASRYDRKYPGFFDRYLKAYGAKVEPLELADGQKINGIKMTPELVKAFSDKQALLKAPDAAAAAELQKFADIPIFDDSHFKQIDLKVKGDVIVPDNVSHELMRSAKAMLAGKDRSEVGLSSGYPLDPEEVTKLTGFFSRAAEIAKEEGLNGDALNKITEALQTAAEKDGHVAWALPEAVGHEKTHVSDARGATDAEGAIKSFEVRYDGATNELRKDPDFQDFHKALNDLQGTTDHGRAMAEALAWLGNGDHEKFGISEAQSINILAKLVIGFAHENGLESLSHFDGENTLYEIIHDLTRKSNSGKGSDARGVEVDQERETGSGSTEGEPGQNDTTGEAGTEDQSRIGRPTESVEPPTPEPEKPKAVTSVKNAAVDTEREARGLSPVEKEARKDFGTVWDKALAEIEKNPDAATNLVQELKNNPKKVPTDEENALLLHRKIQVRNQFDEQADELVKAVEAGDVGAATAARIRLAPIQDALDDLDRVTTAAGTAAGRGLSARRMMANEDFTLAALELKTRAANGGRQLSDKEFADLKKVADEYKSKADLLEQHLADRNAVITQMETNWPNSRVISAAENLVKKLDARADAARSRLAKRGTVFTSGLDPLALKDLAEIGASHIATAGLDVAKWTKQMIDEFGESIKPHLEQLWKASNDVFDGLGAKDKWIGNRPTDATKLRAWKTRAANRLKELNQKVEAGDFTRKKRVPFTKFDAEAIRLKADVERIVHSFNKGIKRKEMESRSNLEKAQDFGVKYRRAAVLSGPSTLAKLTAAALGRTLTGPMEQIAEHGWGKVFPDLAKQMSREYGFRTVAEAKAITEMLTSGLRDSLKNLKNEESDLDEVFGKPQLLHNTALEYFGSIHAALKAPIKRGVFARHMELGFAKIIKDGGDPLNPITQMQVGLQAYKAAQRGIFMQQNIVTKAYKSAINTLERKGENGHANPVGKGIATVLQTLMPIVKIPTNFVGETTKYAVGLPVGLLKVAKAYHAGLETLKPEEADVIMRWLKKGSIGAGALALGAIFPDAIGGYYQGQKRDPKDTPAGSIKLFGHNIPSVLLHTPAIEAMQIGATFRRVMDSKAKKTDEDTQGATMALMASALGLVEEVPFVKETANVSKLLDPKTRSEFLNDLGKNVVVPQLSSQTAAYLDKPKDSSMIPLFGGDPIKRKPTTFGQTLETGIPGLRQNVPEAAPDKSRVSDDARERQLKRAKVITEMDQIEQSDAQGKDSATIRESLQEKLDSKVERGTLTNAEAERANKILGLKGSDAYEGQTEDTPEPKLAGKYGKNADGLIDRIVGWAEALGTDPVDAFDKLAKLETFKRMENGTIIVERMSKDASAAERKRLGGGAKSVKLDHVLPLELGGTNAQDNLKLVTTEEWARYTPIENYLAGVLHDKKISGQQAQDLIRSFKNGWIDEDEVIKRVGEPFSEQTPDIAPSKKSSGLQIPSLKMPSLKMPHLH